MESYLPIYLVFHFFKLFADFLKHWYLDVFYFIFARLLNILRRLDRVFALKWTIGHLHNRNQGQALYILNLFFGGLSVIITSIVYLLLLSAALALYLIWALVPLFFIYKIFNPLFN